MCKVATIDCLLVGRLRSTTVALVLLLDSDLVKPIFHQFLSNISFDINVCCGIFLHFLRS